jgi:hypothetical protein
MPLDILTNPDQVRILGPVTIATNPASTGVANITLDSTGNLTSTGNITVANVTATGVVGGGVLSPGATTAAATIANNGTIASSGRVTRIIATAACTSAALAKGTVDGQELTVLLVGATAVTVSTFVSASTTLSAATASGWEWDAGSTLWYHKV